MKRLLEYKERSFILEALNFYEKYGPSETVVANYHSSYPDNPEKAIVKWDKTAIPAIKELFDINQGPSTYEDMIRVYLLTEMVDLDDVLHMIRALQKIQVELTEKIIADHVEMVAVMELDRDYGPIPEIPHSPDYPRDGDANVDGF